VGVVAVLAIWLLAATGPLLRHGRDDLKVSRLISEHVLALSFLGLPFIVFIAMRITHGGMTPRYSLPAILGIPLALGFVLPRLDRKAIALVMIFILVLLATQEMSFWHRMHEPSSDGRSSAAQVENFVNSVGYVDLPVMASDGRDYLETEHYSSPEWKRRWVAAVDPPGAVAYVGTDSMDKELLVLRLFVPLQVYDFQDFVLGHPKFLLYSTGTPLDWWPVRLSRDGYMLQLLNAEGSRKVYLVSASAKRGNQSSP